MVVDGQPVQHCAFIFSVSHRGLIELKREGQLWEVSTPRCQVKVTDAGRVYYLSYSHVAITP